ncbi:MAG: hypothetical protein ACJAYU_004243 [Bradymonadia bacterium]|jgi:hypothetical protein
MKQNASIAACSALTVFGMLAGCGASQQGVPLDTEVEAVLLEAGPDPLPACPFDMERIRNASVGFNVAIQDEPESWLRLRVVAGQTDAALLFEYELRDVDGREVGVEHFICTPAGLALRSSESDGWTLTFSPPLMVLPVGVDSGQSAGAATLSTDGSAEDVPVGYVHLFEVVPSPQSEFEGEAVQIVSTLRLDGDLTSVIETATVWVIAADFLAPVTRSQSRDGAEVRVESVRTLTR